MQHEQPRRQLRRPGPAGGGAEAPRGDAGAAEGEAGPRPPRHAEAAWSPLAESLVALDRPSESVAIIDDCLRRAEGKVVDPRLVPFALDLRLRAFAKQKDASGCRQTAELWEKLNRTDADSLYNAACFRAVTAGVLRADDRTPDAGQQADAEADTAMSWLAKAVAAGYNTPQTPRPHDAGHRPRRPARPRRLPPPPGRAVRPWVSRGPIRTVRPSVGRSPSDRGPARCFR